ncbi:hypothetical protein [Pedobacter gandavensis]|uniref:Uncharacterized protein n=1 Tax=Pedobacter gandavensis TaxID=2679963 RepID=A0ABR6EVE6_9SPHI|nr:hypothetical protein [Pedobacter gandavensis]MBB2149182.1 hypothetical protein [Pedobacter gandavensis]
MLHKEKNMENYEVVLVSDAQGAVLKATEITLNFQGVINMDTRAKGNMTTVSFTVDGNQESVLRDGTLVSGPLKQMAIRGEELEVLISKMAEGPEKVKSIAKLAIWKTFNTSLQTALTTAMKAQYLLDNPLTQA